MTSVGKPQTPADRGAGSARTRPPRPASRRAIRLALCLAALGSQAVRATEPESVMAGLWEVSVLTFFEPDPQPGATEWPGLPGKTRARKYRVCLDASRARAPMSRPGLPVVESLYRRLSEREFEGSYTLATEDRSVMLQYSSVFLQSDCEGVRPATMSKFGEP